MHGITHYIITLFFLFSAAHPHCQGDIDLPVFYQGSVEQFNLEDGLPDNCVWDRLIDKRGRLWLMNCAAVQIQQGLHLYQFDGYRAHSVNINLSDQANESVYHIAGIDSTERIYGFAYHLTAFFFFQPYDASVQEYQLEKAGSSEQIVSMIDHRDGFYITTISHDRYVIYRFVQGQSQKIMDIPRDPDLEIANPRVYLPEVVLHNSEF